MTIKHSVKLKCLKKGLGAFFNLIGHGVVMEGNRKMTGCLQTFGGHCMYTCALFEVSQYKVTTNRKLCFLFSTSNVQCPPKVWRQPVIFLLPSITTPCPIKFNNSNACSNNLIELIVT